MLPGALAVSIDSSGLGRMIRCVRNRVAAQWQSVGPSSSLVPRLPLRVRSGGGWSAVRCGVVRGQSMAGGRAESELRRPRRGRDDRVPAAKVVRGAGGSQTGVARPGGLGMQHSSLLGLTCSSMKRALRRWTGVA